MASKPQDTATWAAQQERRRKWLSRILAAALWTALAAIIVLYWRDRPRVAAPHPSAATVPKGVRQALTGFTMTRSNKGRVIFTINARRTLEMKRDGRAVLQGVRVQFTSPLGGGNQDVLVTPSAQYNPQTGNLTTTHRVELELNVPGAGMKKASAGKSKLNSAQSAPMILRTSQVSYNRKSSLVESDAPVSFQVGALQGDAVGMKYDTMQGKLELERTVSVQYKPATAVAPIHLAASHLTFSRQTHRAVIRGPVVITQGSRVVRSAAVTLDMNGQNQVTQVQLSGGVAAHQATAQGAMNLLARNAWLRFNSAGNLKSVIAQGDVFGQQQAQGNVSTLRAQTIGVEFVGRTAHPTEATIAGNVELAAHQSRPAKNPTHGAGSLNSSGGARFECATLHLSFRRRGQSLRRATTDGPGTLTLTPANSRAGRRVIQAASFAMAFNQMNRLVTLWGTNGTKITFEPAQGKKTLPAISTARDLVARFDPKAETLTSAIQRGAFKFQEGIWRGKAASAAYSPAEQTIHLIGAPSVTDGASRMQAASVDVNLAKETAVAEGRVVASQRSIGDLGGSADLATHLLADRAILDWGANTADYEGHVRAWRSTDVLVTPSLTLDRIQRTLRARRGVNSSFLEATGSSVPKARAGGHDKTNLQPVSIRAKQLDYSDSTRVAIYEGDVTMVAQGATMHADRMEVWISKSNNKTTPRIERALASGHVRVTEPGRILTAAQGAYSAAQATIVMTGGPPKVVDKTRGSVSGRRLTFFILSDRVLVYGGKHTQAIVTLPVAP